MQTGEIMDTGVIYCTNCGSANEVDTKFCYKCGKPIKALQPPDTSPPLLDFITLACPKCGGQLEITPDMDRFACKYCGNEHLVRRTGGSVSLAPVVEGIKRVEDKFDHALIGADRMAAEQTIQRLKNELPALERQYDQDRTAYNLLETQLNLKPGKKRVSFGILALFLAFAIPLFFGILTSTGDVENGHYSLIAFVVLLPVGLICTISGAAKKRQSAMAIRLAEQEGKLEKAREAMNNSKTLVEDHKKRLDTLHRYTTER
jgi:DNA-directed RNA polymerase subunit RPC12/RpoP